MEYRIEDLTKEEAVYIGEKINEIVPREVDADEEEFVLKVENENGEIIGSGKHEYLMETCPEYKEISDSQMGGAFLE